MQEATTLARKPDDSWSKGMGLPVTDAPEELIIPCLDPWMIAYSRPRMEHIAKAALEREGFECWYPLRKIVTTRPQRTLPSKTRHRRRLECVEKVEPVMGGYLFIRRLRGSFDLGRVYELAGVGGMCRIGGDFACIQDYYIEILRLGEADGRFNVYHQTVPFTYRLSMNTDPRSQWTGTSRFLARVDIPGGMTEFREELGRVLRFVQSIERPESH